VAVNHLSEVQIQEYLDNTIVSGKQDIIAHLDHCPLCRSRVKEYEVLFKQLKKAEPKPLPVDFASKVMKQIEAESSTADRRSAWSVMFAVLGTIIGLISIAYFINFKPVFAFFKLSDIRQYFDRVFLDELNGLARYLNVDIGTILYVGLVLIVIAAIDTIIRHNRRRPISFLI
jgi:hypothetical protein